MRKFTPKTTLPLLVAGLSLPATSSAIGGNAPQMIHGSHGNAMPYSAAPAPAGIPASESGRAISGRPFADPPMIRSRNKRLEVKLIPQATRVGISGKRVNARVFGVAAYGNTHLPSFMPPTLVLEPGDNLRVTLVNKLGEPTNLHTHGFFVSPMGNQDNIFVDLPQKKQFLYNYDLPAELSPGLYWYHPHYHPLVEEQVFGGLSGLIYVRGLEKLLPPSLQGITEHFLGIKDFPTIPSPKTISIPTAPPPGPSTDRYSRDSPCRPGKPSCGTSGI